MEFNSTFFLTIFITEGYISTFFGRYRMDYYIDVYIKRPKYWMKKYGFKEVNGKYGTHLSIKVDEKNKRKIVRRLKWRHTKYRCTEACWNRSSDYRKNFFKLNPGPDYQCRYCNRKLHKENVVVDHVIPISQAKKNKNARKLLKLRGIDNVNDTRNLVASCKKCNQAKDDKMGIWLLKAWLGKYKLYWVVRPIIICSLIAYALYYITQSDIGLMFINTIRNILFSC